MQSKATTVPAYLDELPPERKAELTTLRSVIREAAPAAAETMRYGMPTYEMGEMLCAFAAQKNYLALYVDPAVVEAHRTELGGLDVGKSCIRFRTLDQLPLGVVRTMVAEAARRASA